MVKYVHPFLFLPLVCDLYRVSVMSSCERHVGSSTVVSHDAVLLSTIDILENLQVETGQ